MMILKMKEDAQSKRLLRIAAAHADSYIDSADDKPVYPTNEALDDLSKFDQPLPESISTDGASILDMLHKYGSPATVQSTGGRYFGFVTGGVVPTAAATGWMTQVWDQNGALYVMSPIASKLEQVSERWVVDLLGLPQEETVMGLVGGSSVANLCGLAAGRQALLSKLGWDVNSQGLFGAPRLRVVVNEQAHSSVWKALSLLGLGNGSCVERVPVDDQGRMRVDQLPKLDNTTLVILQAGHVSTGAFDDLDSICDKANGAGAWVHVDGAFGLWAAASKSLRYLTKGLEKANSWCVDGHKTLNTPYDCGIVLCRDASMLHQAMAATGSYLQTSDTSHRDGMFYTPDMSRRGGRAIELWATLKYLGRDGVEQMIDGMVDRAQQFGNLLKAAGFQILNEIVFNQCLVRCDSSEETKITMANIQSSGALWCGGSTWNEEPAIRISVCAWATTSTDVENCVESIVQARDKARSSLLKIAG